jgi:hypothetical protein
MTQHKPQVAQPTKASDTLLRIGLFVNAALAEQGAGTLERSLRARCCDEGLAGVLLPAGVGGGGLQR